MSPHAYDPSPLPADLVDRLRRGELSAFEMLVDTFKGPIYRLACCIAGDYQLAEDAAQGILLKVWQQPDILGDGSHVGPTLLRMARNAAVDAWRASKRRSKVGGFDISEVPEVRAPIEASPEMICIAKETQSIIMKEIARLPVRQRSAVELCLIQGFSQSDAADIMNISHGSLRGDLFRARCSLMKRLQSKGIRIASARGHSSQSVRVTVCRKEGSTQ